MHFRHKVVLFIVVSIALGPLIVHANPALEGAGTGPQQSAGESGTLASSPTGDLQSLYALADTDPKAADEALDRLLSDPRFSAQPPDFQHDAYSLSAWLSLQRENHTKALERSRQRVAANAGVMEDWYPLAALEFDAGNRAASAKALARLARQWPDKIDGIEFGLVAQLVSQSRLETPIRLELLQGLTQADWRRGRIQNSDLWYELTLAQALDGQAQSARASAQHVFSPDALIKLRSDKQFDGLIDRDSAKFDVGLAARTQVQDLQRIAGESPDSLEVRNELNDAMLTAGMTEAALVHADLILSKLAQLSDNDPLFSDKDAKIWTMNNRAVALRRLGRPEEAAQQLAVASKLDENGGANVSQILNLAQFYCSMGRPADARLALARLGEGLSPYGRMVKASAEHRIALQLKDPKAATQAMAYLHEHRNDSQDLYFWALLEAQQLDQAADLLKGLLAVPEDRTEALGWAQRTLQAPPLPGDVLPTANRKAVLARADVQAAIARVGYVESYPVFTGYMGD